MVVSVRVLGIAAGLAFCFLSRQHACAFTPQVPVHPSARTMPKDGGSLKRRRVSALKQRTGDLAKSNVEECFEEASVSLRACARFALASFAVDVVLESPELLEKPWPDRAVQGIAMIWKLTLALDLLGFSRANEENNRGQLNSRTALNLPVIVDTSYRYMSRLWRRTAWVLLVESAASIAGELKGRHQWVPPTFVGVTVALVVALRLLSAREFQTVEMRNGHDDKTIDPSSLQKAYATFQNMALCTASLIARASVMPLMLAVATDRKPVPILKTVMVFRTRSTIAFFLWKLRRATLQGFDAAVRSEATPEVRSKLYKAQSRFFEKAADIFKEEAAVKVALTFAALILPFLRTS